jgi:integrase
MAKQLLTDAKLAGIAGDGKARWIQDNTGLYVKVSPAGTCTFCTRYQLDGLRRWLYHGAFPAMSLAKARALHIEAVGAAGDARVKRDPELDPSALRAAKRQQAAEEKRQREQAHLLAPSVADFVELYLVRYANKRKRSAPEDRRILFKDVAPALGALKMKEVTRPNIVEVIDRIESREAFNQAWQTFKVMRRLFNYAIERGVIEKNPCQGIRTTSTYTPKSRVLGDADIRRLFSFMDSPACGWSSAVKLAVEFQLVTASRPGETRGALWSEIDTKAGAWTVAADRAKMKKPHVVPLTDRALAVMERAKKLPTMAPAFIFPGIEKDKPLSEQAVSKAIARDLAPGGGLAELGIVEPFTPHDMRRTAATHMAALGFGSVVPFVLGHTPQTVTGVHYDKHNYMAEKRAALEAWAQRLDGIAAGAVSNVVPILSHAAA